MSDLFTLILYAVAGSSLKIQDEINDSLDRPRLACLVSPVFGLSFGFLMLSGPEHASLALGIVLGNLLSRKVDAPAHWLALGLSLAVGVLRAMRINPIVLIVATGGALLDEIGHDRITESLFFRYRGVLKATMLALATIRLVSWTSFVGLMLFDFLYELSGLAFSWTATGIRT